MKSMRGMRAGFGLLVVMGAADVACAQFGVPASTPIRERVVGVVISDEGFPVPEAGDQIGAFDGDLLVGRFVFEAGGGDGGEGEGDGGVPGGDDDLGENEFSIMVFGDNPATPEKDGARQEASITFKFFDAGTEVETTMRVQNGAGERAVYRYRGTEVPPIDILPIDLTRTRSFNLRLTEGGDDGNGGGGGGGGDGADFDVNNDGAINDKDVVIVLRAVSGAQMTMTDDELAAADVTGDGLINTQDAIAIMRNR